MTTRTYWLSFCDDDRPVGDRFLGVVIVDVTEAEAIHALEQWERRRGSPMRDLETGPWLAAAMATCWQAGVNPGGAVQSLRIDDAPGFAALSPRYPRLRLLCRAELEVIDVVGHA